jgi:cold shock protein
VNGGTLKFFCPTRAFGFIVPDEAGPDVFVHKQQFDQAGMTPVAGMRLSFERRTLSQGGVKADKLRPETALK